MLNLLFLHTMFNEPAYQPPGGRLRHHGITMAGKPDRIAVLHRGRGQALVSFVPVDSGKSQATTRAPDSNEVEIGDDLFNLRRGSDLEKDGIDVLVPLPKKPAIDDHDSICDRNDSVKLPLIR
jgi:hypothetical protein